MKNIIFILTLFTLLVITPYAKAQFSPELVRRNIIKTNPLAMLQGPIVGFGEYRLMGERALTPCFAAQVSLGYLGKGIFNQSFYTGFNFANPYSKVKYNGYRVTGGFKYYFDCYAPTGWYLMALGSYSLGKMASTYDPSTDYITATFINATLNVGYQVLAGDRFAVDMYTGLGWKSNIWRGYGQYHKDPTLPEQTTSAKFNLCINIGYAF